MKPFLACVLLVLLHMVGAPRASAETVTIEVQGEGPSLQAAVSQALVSAIEQVTGVAVEATQRAALDLYSASDERDSVVVLQQRDQQVVRRQSGGIVRQYRITDRGQATGLHSVRLVVEIEVFRPTVPTGDTRRRLIVSEFRDETGRQTQFGQALRDRLLQHLTQSRRFAILDRDANAAYDREMALLLTDAPLTERVRVGQVLGADYVVVGRLRNVGAVRREQHLSLTGETIVHTSARGSLDFQVLEIATRQVRWAANVGVSNSGNLTAVLEEMAVRIGREITQTIYPMRIVRVLSPSEIILNQGGVTVTAGQRFRAMALGDELVDPYTRESLGQVEQEIGVVEVTRVDPRVSYARLIAGQVPTDGQEVLLRPAPPAPVPVAAPRSTPRPAPPRERSMFD